MEFAIQLFANLSFLLGGYLALSVLPSLTSHSKGRAARWRFWGLVFIKVRWLRLAFSTARLCHVRRTRYPSIEIIRQLPHLDHTNLEIAVNV